MPKGKVLGHDCGPRAKQGHEGHQKESNQAEHPERIRAENESEGAGPGNAGTSVG
jgi:hypothetical protein